MAKANVILIVATECTPVDEARFNKWYNEVHIPMIMKYKGVVKATRYQLAGEAKGQSKYLAIYEYADMKSFQGMSSSKEVKAALEEMQQSWKGADFLKWSAAYEPIKAFER